MENEKRKFVHGLWSSVAESWIERADYLEQRAEVVTKAILEGASLRPADRVLALADGPGGMALAVAPWVAGVVSSDVVPELAAAAAKRAAEQGAANVSSAVIDIEDIDAADASFDVVVSREGLMFAVDPARCFGEVVRVLRPKGRVAAAVWGAPEDNPWLSIVMDSVSNVIGRQVPPPGMPGPFALADEARLRSLATGAGLARVRVDRVDIPFYAPSFDEWWNHTTALAGPIANIVRGLDGADLEKLLALLHERVAPYAVGESLELPGVSLVLSGCKP